LQNSATNACLHIVQFIKEALDEDAPVNIPQGK
jgi:hypothetical protein